jgi:hypothetical protein
LAALRMTITRETGQTFVDTPLACFIGGGPLRKSQV